MAEIITASEVTQRAAELREKVERADRPMTGVEIEKWIVGAFQSRVQGLVDTNTQLSQEKKSIAEQHENLKQILQRTEKSVQDAEIIVAGIKQSVAALETKLYESVEF